MTLSFSLDLIQATNGIGPVRCLKLVKCSIYTYHLYLGWHLASCCFAAIQRANKVAAAKASYCYSNRCYSIFGSRAAAMDVTGPPFPVTRACAGGLYGFSATRRVGWWWQQARRQPELSATTSTGGGGHRASTSARLREASDRTEHSSGIYGAQGARP